MDICRVMNVLSVIVPVYNAGAFLVPLINSILSQTYSNLELLLVDDGSTDGSAGICDYYASQDPRVRVFHKPNGGQSESRNVGLDKATGDLIAFADHDDILHPRMYETLAEALEGSGASVSACGFINVTINQIESLSFDCPVSAWSIIPSIDVIHRFFTPSWHVPVWNKLYTRNLIGELRFHGTKLGEDNLFSYQIAKKCGCYAFCDTPMYYQRMHGNNFEFTGSRHMVELVQSKEAILNDILLSFPSDYRNAQKCFLDECVRVFNMYVDMADPTLSTQKQAVFDIMKRNSTSLLKSSLPLGQIIRFYHYRAFFKNAPEHKIHL